MLPLSRLEGNSGFRVILYGIESWRRLVLGRQYAMLGTFSVLARKSRDTCRQCGYVLLTIESIQSENLTPWFSGGMKRPPLQPMVLQKLFVLCRQIIKVV